MLVKQKEYKKEVKSKQVYESLVRLLHLKCLDSTIRVSDDFQCCDPTLVVTLSDDLERRLF
jgi:hypothetical protein